MTESRKLLTLLRLQVSMRWAAWRGFHHRRAAQRWFARFEADDRTLKQIAHTR